MNDKEFAEFLYYMESLQRYRKVAQELAEENSLLKRENQSLRRQLTSPQATWTDEIPRNHG